MIKAFGKAITWAVTGIIDPVLQTILKDMIWLPFKLLLEIFNFVEYAFLWLTGIGGNKFLFNTTIDESGLSNNFFKSPSMVQQTYLIFFGISGGLFVLFILLKSIKTMVGQTHKKSGILSSMYLGSGALLSSTLIPTLVMTLLGLVGGLTTIFTSGSKLPPSSTDVELARECINKNIKEFANLNNSNSLNANEIYRSSELVFPYLKIAFNAKDNQTYEDWLQTGSKPEITLIEKFENDLLGNNKLWETDVNTNSIFDLSWKNSSAYSQINLKMNKNNFALPFGTNKNSTTTNYGALKNIYGIISKNINTSESALGYINDSFSADTIEVIDSLDNYFISSENMFSLEDNKINLNKELIDRSKSIYVSIDSLRVGYNEVVSKSLYDYQNDLLVKTQRNDDLISLINLWNIKWMDSLDLKTIENNTMYSFDWAGTSNNFDSVFSQMIINNLFNRVDEIISLVFEDTVYGQGQGDATIRTLKDVRTYVDDLIYGNKEVFLDGSGVNISNLANKTTEFGPTATTIALYKIASGNNDSNWKKDPSRIKIGNLLVSFVLMAMAWYVYAQLIPRVIFRIMAIATLFVTSPIYAIWATIDEGKKFYKWFDVLFSNVVCILILLVTFRIYNLVVEKIIILIESSGESLFQDATLRNIFIGMLSVFALMCVPRLVDVVSKVLAVVPSNNIWKKQKTINNPLLTKNNNVFLNKERVNLKNQLISSSNYSTIPLKRKDIVESSEIISDNKNKTITNNTWFPNGESPKSKNIDNSPSNKIGDKSYSKINSPKSNGSIDNASSGKKTELK